MCSTTNVDAIHNELEQLGAIYADCLDLEEPVPASVRARRAALRRELRQLGKAGAHPEGKTP